MASVGIIDVFDKIKRSNGDYCKVCFRTSRERKLVTPVFFERFLNAVNSCLAYKSEIKVCFICERLAMSAMKFHRALFFGIELDELFGMMHSYGVREYILKHFEGAKSNSGVCKRAKACEEQYQKLQESVPYSLQCTNTLLVTVDDAAQPAKPGVRKPQSTPTTNDEVVVLDDDQPPPLARLSGPVVGPTDGGPHGPVVGPTVGGPHGPVVGTQGNNTKVPKNSEQVLLHPMITGVDGNIYVPTLNLQIVANKDFCIVPDHTLYPTVNGRTEREKMDERKKETEKMDERKMERDKKTEKMTVGYSFKDFLRLQNDNNRGTVYRQEMVRTENLNIVLNCDDSESSSKKTKFEEDPLKIDAVVSNPKSSDTASTYVENGVKMKNDGKEKRPLLSMARVDWEDKIPMDVISFMDATDPNPNERIMQPNTPALGVISNVRSVEEEDVQIIENVECIDLC